MGHTSLFLAVHNGHNEIAALLLKKGAAKDAKVEASHCCWRRQCLLMCQVPWRGYARPPSQLLKPPLLDPVSAEREHAAERGVYPHTPSHSLTPSHRALHTSWIL